MDGLVIRPGNLEALRTVGAIWPWRGAAANGIPIRRQPVRLIGHNAELGVLDRLPEDVRSGASRPMVLHGEAGDGKTALLDYVAARRLCRIPHNGRGGRWPPPRHRITPVHLTCQSSCLI